MNCWSTFKTLIHCQLSDNHSFQSYSQLSFPSLAVPPHSELHYSALDPMLPINYQSSQSSFQSHLKPGRRYASRQLSELTTVAFRATKILSTVRVDIAVDRSFQSYQNPVNSES